jgi:tetratricopeptide (TPR) repeat protein
VPRRFPSFALSPRVLGAGLLGFLLPLPGAADIITLTNGHVIEADRAWYEGSQLRYEKNGGVFGLPRDMVQSVDAGPRAQPVTDAEVLKSREKLAAQDPGEALRFARLALFHNPQSVPALQALAEAQLALGELPSARETAQRAVRLDEKNARSRWLLGDILVALGDRARAQDEYRRSLLLRPDPLVRRKLADIAPPAATAAPEAQFRIRYDGGVNEPLGMAVLKALSDSYSEYTKRLGFSPDFPVTVVLETNAGFRDTTQAPEWAEGWNDGTIRVPVMGLDQPNPRLLRVLRHELAHSFVAARTGNNCPVWLQEGIAQWLEGGDPERGDSTLAPLARAGRLPNLLTLEGPFHGLTEGDAAVAYAESLSAVAHILRTRGEAGVVRLVSALSDRLPSEEALPVALALSYAEFQKSWEEALRGEKPASPGNHPPSPRR